MLLSFGLGLSLSPVHGQNLSQGMATLLQTLELIRAKALNPPGELPLMRGAIRGMLKSLNDPYSSYLEPADFQALKSEEIGQVVGVGVELDYREQEVVVMSVLDQTPAAAAGLQSGDKIIEIDGQNISRLSWSEILRRMQGASGQKLLLKIQPANQSIPRTVSLQRQVLNLQAVEFRPLPGELCLLRVRTFFNANLHQEVEEKLLEGLSNCSAGLILDLRNNPGGLVTEAIAVAGQLGVQGTVMQIVSREGQIQPEDTQTEALLPDTLPLVVLINGGTASAAEVLAASLQENGRAVLVGETSFGKGLVQSLLPLLDGSGLLLTTHGYLTSRGNNLHKIGIPPDIPAKDPQKVLEEAQTYLQAGSP